MAKYIKLEDAIHNINLEVTGRKEYTGDMKANLFFALDDLQTFEMSEDCISRKWLEKNFQTVCENVRCNECPFDSDDCRLIEFIVDAPSVVPKWCIGEVDCPYVIDQDCVLQKCSGELSMEEQYKNCPLRRKG